MKRPLRPLSLSRRQFMQTSLAAGAIATTPLDALAARRHPRRRAPTGDTYPTFQKQKMCAGLGVLGVSSVVENTFAQNWSQSIPLTRTSLLFFVEK